QYYTMIRPSQCADCATENTIRFETVRLALFFPVPSTLPVAVSVVGAAGADSCPTPDLATLLCPSESFELAATDSMSTVEFALTLPEPCTFVGNAFLKLDFFAPGTGYVAATRPRLVLTGCNGCTSFNDYDYDDVPDDLC